MNPASTARRAMACVLAALGCVAAPAQPATVEAGHTVLRLPEGAQVFAAPLPRGSTGGDAIGIERKLVLLGFQGRPAVAVVLIETTREARRYRWTGGCEQLRSDEHTFVHNPFHATRNECGLAFGPVDLADTMARRHADAAQVLRAAGQPVPVGAGYLFQATFTSSGSMLSATVLARERAARLPASPEGLPAGTGLPATVVAWALALLDQVRGAMGSVTGTWQLPPLDPNADADEQPAPAGQLTMTRPRRVGGEVVPMGS